MTSDLVERLRRWSKNPFRAMSYVKQGQNSNFGFGFHRFDYACPEYVEDACIAYCPSKGGA